MAKKQLLKPILPIRAVPKISKIEQINPVQAIQPITGFHSIQAQKQAYNKNQKQVETFLSNYNDPTELNSFIDALTNREAVSKKFGEAWGTASTLSGTVSVLSFAGAIIASLIPGGQAVAPVLAKIGAVTAVPAVPAAVDVTVEKGIKPVVAGKPKEAALNMLMNLGETMDAVANPVKGLVLEGPSGFAKGTGLASGGRVNYDYDTGFFLTDMLLEIVTDPMNWVDFGTGTVMKKATKDVAESMTKELSQQAVHTVNKSLAKTVGEITAEGSERISKQVSKTTAQVAREWASKNLDDLTDEAKALLLENGRNRIQQSLVQAIRNELPNATEMDIKGLLSDMSKHFKDDRMVRGALAQIEDFGFDTLSSDVIKGLANAQRYSDSFQKFLTANAFRTSGYGMGIELAKKGFKPIKEWASNTILRKLKVSRVFNENTGIDLKQWTKAKAIWEAGGAYVNKITGQLTERNIDTFYECISEQLVRDQSAIIQLLKQLSGKPIEQATALDNAFKGLYGLDFYRYIDTLEQIAKLEGNTKVNFAEYIKFANDTKDYIYKATALVRSGNVLKSGSALFDIKSLDQLIQRAESKLQELLESKTGADLTQTTYAIKLGNEYVDSILLQEKNINEVMTAIHTDEAIGNALKQIIEDNNAVKEGANAEYLAAAQIVKQTAASYKNTEMLADRIAQLVVPNIPGLNDTALKRYILNEIRGAGALKTTSELYDNISLSVNDLFERLRELTTDYKTHESLFNISDYPELAPQIEDIYSTYLKAQKEAGVEDITDLINSKFTYSVLLLEEPLSKVGLTDLMQPLKTTTTQIKSILDAVEKTNTALLGSLLVNKQTIFDGFKYRELIDMGLAVRTITVKENLAMFYVPNDISNITFDVLNKTGAKIRGLTKSLNQYSAVFDDELVKRINAAYTKFFDYLTKEGSAVPISAFKYLQYNLDPMQQFAQMAVFKQLIEDEDYALKAVFKTFTGNDYDLDYKLFNPNAFMTTEFAWDGMAQSAIVADKQFAEELINMRTTYKNLSAQSVTLTDSFQQMRKAIADSKLDDPRAIILERYLREIEPMNNFLKYIEKKYDDLFDLTAAEEVLEKLRKVCNDFPVLDKKYSKLINKLDDYWHGRHTFKQDPKFKKAELGADYTDEFTAFWNEVAAMREDINNVVTAEERAQIYQILKDRRKAAFDEMTADFKKQYNLSEVQHFIPAVDHVPGYGGAVWPTDTTINGQNTRAQVWYRKHTSDTPYNQIDYYDSVKDIQYVAKEDYLDKSGKYKTITAEFFKDPDYAESRRLYTEKYTYYRHVMNAIKDAHKAVEVGDFPDFNSALGNSLAKYYTTSEGGRAFVDAERQQYYEAVLQDVLQKHSKELEEAYAYTQTASNWYTDYLQSVDKFYESFTKADRNILERIRNAKSPQQGWYYTHNLGLSKDAMRKLKLYTSDGELNTHANVYLNFQNLRDKARFKKFDELFDNKIATDLRAEMGARHKEILAKRFEPIYEKIKQEWEQEFAKQLKFEYLSFDPWTPFKKQQEFNKLVNRATNKNAKATIYSLLNLAPEKFVEELACRHRFIVLFDDDLADPYMKKAYNNLANKLSKDKRVRIVPDKDLGCNWIILDKSQKINASGRQFYLNGKPIARTDYTANFDEFKVVDDFLDDDNNPGFVEHLNKLSNTLETLTGSKLGMSQGEVFSEEMLQKIYKQMPEHVKALIDADEFFNKELFGAYLFNESILGSSSSKRKLGLYSSNMIANARSALVQAQCYLKPKNEYVNNVFDTVFSISGKNSIYANYSDADLLEALQANTDYKLVALVDDPKYGVKVREVYPTSVEAIAKARELNAVVVPLQVYKDMYNAVNHRIGSAGIAKIWSRIMYAYKFGYLCRPGAWIRNWVDTNLKSYFEMGSDRKMYFDKAQKYLNEYDSIKDFVQARKKLLKETGQDAETLTQMYKQYFGMVEGSTNMAKHLTYDSFTELKDRYFSKGVADNIMRDMYESEIKDGWDMFTHVTGKVIDWGNGTERVNRLATYLYELDRGLDQTSALAKLSKIHFDYSFKTKAEQLVDMVFPFTTFSLRNYSYWAEMLEKHPWLLRNYTHIMKPSWDFKDYTPQELARDKRIQAQILYGQVKLAEFNNKVITFKANPSIQDAIQMFSDPINNVYEKLAAPIAYPLSKATGDYTSPINMLPVAGPAIQSIKSMVKTGTPMPSAIGVIPKRTQKTTNIKFSNKNYSGIDKFKDTQYRVPNYRKNVVYDAYATKGVTKYRANMYPIIDVYHDIKSKYTVNVYNKIKNKVKTDVYKGIRYSLRLDVNRWR